MDKKERKKLEARRKERISNRLVMNFAILLLAAFALLYLYKFLISGYNLITIKVLLVIWIASAAGAVAFFVLGLVKWPKIKNYSAIFLGVFLVSFVFWFATSGVSPFPTNVKYLTVGTYAAMAVYFIVLAIISSIQTRRIPKEYKKQ